MVAGAAGGSGLGRGRSPCPERPGPWRTTHPGSPEPQEEHIPSLHQNLSPSPGGRILCPGVWRPWRNEALVLGADHRRGFDARRKVRTSHASHLDPTHLARMTKTSTLKLLLQPFDRILAFVSSRGKLTSQPSKLMWFSVRTCVGTSLPMFAGLF